MPCHQIVSDRKIDVSTFPYSQKHVLLNILGEIKLNLMKEEKYLKSVFFIDQKLHDARNIMGLDR